MSKRGAYLGYLGTLGLGAAVLLVVGLTTRSTLAYSPGATPVAPLITLEPGQRACVAPLVPPTGTEFERVSVFAGAPRGAGPPLAVDVATTAVGPSLGRGRIPGGYRGNTRPTPVSADVGRIRSDQPLVVCLRNAGAGPGSLFGGASITSYPATSVDGVPADADVSVRLDHSHSRSLLASLPAAFTRAARFKAGWIVPGVLWGLTVLVLLGVPALVAVAVRRADVS